MTTQLLEKLKPEFLSASVPFVLPPAVMRIALQRVLIVRRVSWALRRGQLPELEFREFVASMTADLQAGRQLPGDLSLAALAVAAESCSQAFAEEYLCDLARLRLAEMPVSIRVARECLKARYALPKNEIRKFRYPDTISAHSRGARATGVKTYRAVSRSTGTRLKFSVAAGAT